MGGVSDAQERDLRFSARFLPLSERCVAHTAHGETLQRRLSSVRLSLCIGQDKDLDNVIVRV
jgi:hypothetical protein